MWPLLPLPVPAWPGLLVVVALAALTAWRLNRRWAVLVACAACWSWLLVDRGGWLTVVQIPVQAIAICTGLLLGFWLIQRRAPPGARRHLPLLIGAGLLTGLLGARLTYILVYGLDRGLLAFDGGMVLLGGALPGLLIALAMARWRGLALRPLADAALPPLLIALAIGRLGCWANSCCFGQPGHAPWAHPMPGSAPTLTVVDGELASAAPSTYAAWRCQQLGADIHAPRHPVQLYEALAMALLGLALLVWHPRRAGTVAATAIIGYAAWRFGIELLRGDKPPGDPLTDSQWLALCLLPLGLCLLLLPSSVVSDGPRLASPGHKESDHGADD